MPYKFIPPDQDVTNIPSLICGNRMEPRTRSAEFNRSLRAEVRDAAWMLARQWQLKEFRAEDRGSPVSASFTIEHAPLNQFQIGNAPIATFNGLLPQPLDAMVQALPPVVDWGMRMQMGVQWTRMLRRSGLDSKFIGQVLDAMRQSSEYVLELPNESTTNSGDYSLEYALASTNAEAYEVLQSLGATAFDGYKLLLHIVLAIQKGDFDTFLTSIGAHGQNAGTLTELAVQFKAWYDRLYYQQTPYYPEYEPDQGGQPLGAWSVKELAYRFKAAAPSSSGVPVVVQAREHLGENMDWYTVDEVAGATAGFNNPQGLVQKPSATAVPTEIQFTGAPNPRWWEFEDRQVDFGQITADSTDMGRMVLQDFMFLYHNDWFSFPCSVPTGSICTIKQLTVTDVFGLTYAIQPAGNNRNREQEPMENGEHAEIDHDWGQWSVFALSTSGNRQSSTPRLLLPPTAIGTMNGPVLEQVFLAREEATNLVWGVEQIIPDEMGRGMDGSSAAARVGEYLRTRAQPVTPLATAAKLEYELSSPTTENWIPFVPRQEPVPPPLTNDSYLALEQGEMLRQVEGLVLKPEDLTIKPRTSLLKYPETNYLIHERQVPPVGVRIEGNYRRARWFDGTTVTWYGRRRGNGRPGGSSGLAYDQLLPREARTGVAYFAITAAQYVTTGLASGDAQLRAVNGGIPFLDRVQLRELDAAGNVLTGTANTLLDITRSQLRELLREGDHLRIANTTDPVQLVTVGTEVYVQRTSLASPLTAGDKLGTFPPAGSSTVPQVS